MRRATPLLALLALAACDRNADVQRSAQLRYKEHTLAEWWVLRRDPNDETTRDAATAMRMLGPAAIPFLAVKAAGPDLGDVIGGGTALEAQCPGSLAAMEDARRHHASNALDAAIRRVRADSAARVHSDLCDASGAPTDHPPADVGGRLQFPH